MKARALLVLAALIFGACNEEQPPTPPASFDRPTRVGFACFRLAGAGSPKTVALADCAPNPESTSTMSSPFALHALVVQSSRGEVAAVELQGPGKVLDSRPDIPGYTFLPVGELPSAIAVPALADHARYTYVVNAGSRDLTVLNTRAFRQLAKETRARVQNVMLPGGPHDAPYDMVLSPEEDALFVTMPESGRLLRVPIQRCPDALDTCADGEIDAEGITEIPLTRSLERAVAAPDGGPGHDPYAELCSYALPLSNASIPVSPPAADTPNQPHPGGLALDNFCPTDTPCPRRLLIADENLPFIHVVDLDTLATDADASVQAPILTGAPTRTVAVTPRVPATLGDDAAETQYVYAIDARDGSVLVTENGQLLEVGTAGSRNDRISLGAGATVPVATTLSIVTPAFDVHGPAVQYSQLPTPEQLANPAVLPMPTSGNYCIDSSYPTRINTRLRGVFLAVGVTDGSVRVVDVHDMDLDDCRQCENPQCDCRSLPNANAVESCVVSCNRLWDPYPVVRHRVRISSTPVDTTQRIPPTLTPRAAPAFTSGNQVTSVRTNGATSDPEIPGLECVRCEEGQELAYGEVGENTATPDSGMPDGGAGDAGMGDAAAGDAAAGDAAMPEDDDFTQPCTPGTARVCALADPWAELEDWRAEYRGVLPGTLGGLGRFTPADDGTIQFGGQSDFCRTGVLGSDVLPRGAGDHITILGEIAPDEVILQTPPRLGEANSSQREAFDDKVLETCKELIARRDATENPVPIAFQILAAYADHVTVSEQLVDRPTNIDPTAFSNDVALINKCFGNQLLTYQVRAGRGYVVVGRNTVGFKHRVHATGAAQHCEPDLSIDVRETGRALEGVPFDNSRITFQIRMGGSPQVGTFLDLNLIPSVGKTATSASQQVNDSIVSSLPTDLRWSSADSTLYMVDVASRGLLPISCSPFPLGGLSRSYQ